MLDNSPLSHAIIFRPCKAVYFPIPKAGCSSIKNLLRSAEGLSQISGDMSRLHDRELNGLTYPHMVDMQEFHHLLHTDTGHKHHFFCFTVSRNPYTRLASAYLDKVSGKYDDIGDQGRSIEHLRWTLYRATGRMRQELSFEDFIKALSLSRVADFNRHWQHQTVLACTSFVKHDWKIQIENLADVRLQRMKKLGLPSDTIIENLNKTGANARLSEIYTPATADKVREIYTRDFAAFKYDDALPKT